jgi:3-keto-5-aminohexanoate cleavage enzyme
MTTPCIISVAITGSLPRKKDNPAVPVTVSEQIESTHAAYEAGATLVHLHVRNDDETPTSAPDRFAQVLDGIRRHCPLIVTQVSTGGRSGAGRERGGMLHLRPDMASLASGSVNFPTRVYDNPPELIDWLAGEMKRHGVKPEIEAFDLSMIFSAVALRKADRIAGPLHVQFVMGVKNAMPVDREVFEFYVRTLHRLAPDATWTGAGIGRDQLTLAKWSLELGGHCRTGLEDNVRLDRDTLAPSNAALVKQVAELCEQVGRRVATPQEARALLHLAATPERRTAVELHADRLANAGMETA